MSFGDDFTKGFFGSDHLKDYKHASKTFVANGYELAPKHKFLFHVRFNLNTAEIPQLASLFPAGDVHSFSLAVKSADLPSYKFELDEMNQYNRKRLVQSKISYDPVSIVFHDDGSDLVRSMWYNYFSYYYKDPSHAYNNTPSGDGSSSAGAGYNSRDTYDQTRATNEWGYTGEGYGSDNKPRFFTDITIYGLNHGEFSQYTLINPMIADWKHDTYDYSESDGTMQHTMTLDYETVKYYSGKLDGQNPDSIVKGFADQSHYDTTPSALRTGTTETILGKSGLLDGITGSDGIIKDLSNGNFLGALQTAGSLRETFSGANLGSLAKAEGLKALTDIVTSAGSGAARTAASNAFSFWGGPSSNSTPQNTAASNTTVNTPIATSSATPAPKTTQSLSPAQRAGVFVSSPSPIFTSDPNP